MQRSAKHEKSQAMMRPWSAGKSRILELQKLNERAEEDEAEDELKDLEYSSYLKTF